MTTLRGDSITSPMTRESPTRQLAGPSHVAAALAPPPSTSSSSVSSQIGPVSFWRCSAAVSPSPADTLTRGLPNPSAPNGGQSSGVMMAGPTNLVAATEALVIPRANGSCVTPGAPGTFVEDGAEDDSSPPPRAARTAGPNGRHRTQCRPAVINLSPAVRPLEVANAQKAMLLIQAGLRPLPHTRNTRLEARGLHGLSSHRRDKERVVGFECAGSAGGAGVGGQRMPHDGCLAGRGVRSKNIASGWTFSTIPIKGGTRRAVADLPPRNRVGLGRRHPLG